MPVEDQLVLAAHRVAERDEARVVSRAGHEHLLALDLLTDMERRRTDVHEQLCAGERKVGRRRSGLPHVLADRHADKRLADFEQDEVVARCEVAVLVEDSIVRQEALAVHGLDVAVRADRACVVEIRVEMREADERHQPTRLLCDLVERARSCPHEAGPQQ